MDLEAWMLDAGRIGRGWLLDGRRDRKQFAHARRSRRSADLLKHWRWDEVLVANVSTMRVLPVIILVTDWVVFVAASCHFGLPLFGHAPRSTHTHYYCSPWSEQCWIEAGPG